MAQGKIEQFLNNARCRLRFAPWRSKLRNAGILVGLAVVILAFVLVQVHGQKNAPLVCAMSLDESEVSEDVVRLVFGQIESVLSSRPDLRIIDRSRVEEVRREQAFQQSDYSDATKKTVELGKALGANLLCFVAIYQSSYSVEFMNVNTFQKRTFNGRLKLSSRKRSAVTVRDLKKLRTLNLKFIADGGGREN